MNDRGFTIVETIVAAAILATALVALAQVIAVATTTTTRARDMTRATLAAAQKLEELRASTFSEAAVDATDVADERFRRHWTLAPLSGGGAVVITVEVESFARTVPPVRLETIRARPGSGEEP